MIRRCFNRFLLFFCLGFVSVQAQDNALFGQVWLDQGLSQSSVMCINQNKQGFMLFGTQDGLNRYDGRQVDKYNFQPFNPHSISGDNIQGICPDTGNAVWVLSFAALDFLDLNTGKSTNVSLQLKENKKKGRFVRKVWSLNGKIYLMTPLGFSELIREQKGGFKLKTYTIRHENKKEEQGLVQCAAVVNEDIYISTNDGIFVCPAHSNIFERFQPAGIPKTTSDLFLKYSRVLFTHQDHIYFSQGNNFYEYSLSKKTLHTFTTGSGGEGLITAAIIDRRNEIWIGTESSGVYTIKHNAPGEFELSQHYLSNAKNVYGLKSNFITCLFQSQRNGEDIVWIGTSDAGVFNYSYSKNSFQLISASMKEADLNFFGVVKDKDNVIWAGTHSRIYKIDRRAGSISFIDVSRQVRQSGRPFEAMYCDADNEVWMGNGNSLFKMDRLNNTLSTVAEHLTEEPGNGILRINALNKDELILASWQGLIIYNKINGKKSLINSVQVEGKTISISSVGALYVDRKKNIWLGTMAGLIYIDRSTSKSYCYTYNPRDKNSLLSSMVLDIQESTTGEILIATTKGLSILKNAAAGVFENYYQAPGLANNFIYGLLPDKAGNFWMTTNYGIALFNPAKRSFRTYKAKDGTYINEFNSGGFYAAADGELLFGGLGGLVGLYPEKMVKNKLIPEVLVQSFKINLQNADSLLGSLQQSISLSYSQNHLYFDFSVPDYGGEEDMNLYFRIENFQPEWMELKKTHSLSLANLAPGTYVIEVKAVSAEGIASEKTVRIPFVIHPPFWGTWWFYLLVVCLIVLFAWIVYKNRLNRKINLLRKMEQVRQEENEKVRKAAALDLHDEFGNGLTRISMLVEMAKIKFPKGDKETVKLLDVIAENSARLYQGTKDFIWSINPGNDNLYEVMIRIKDFGDELLYGTGTAFEINGLMDEFKDIRQLPGTGRNLTMIFKEALSNIVKHAKAEKIVLTIERKDEAVVIRLKDNGKGFDEHNCKQGFGISNMKQRAARIEAMFELISEPGKGSELILILKTD